MKLQNKFALVIAINYFNTNSELYGCINDGYNIDKVELYSLRRQIGIVPQEPLLFAGSINENISLTDPEATSYKPQAPSKKVQASSHKLQAPRSLNQETIEND